VNTRSPFSPRAVLARLAVGGVAFLVLLYALGAGWTGGRDRNGGAHAAANGLNGFAGLVKLLEASGEDVQLSRGEARLDDTGRLVLTPPTSADGKTLSEIVEARRYIGPTLLILPKWMAVPADAVRQLDAPRGWVVLGGPFAPPWLHEIEGFGEAKLEVAERKRWAGMGLTGALPEPRQVLALDSPDVLPLVTDETGDVLAGYLDDGGAYPVLDKAGGFPARDLRDEDLDTERWALVIVAEPDLLNNYGMADAARAELAMKIVHAAKEGQDLPVVFDLTLAGLGGSRNLLTLAFAPPFLAATLCLILAALVIAWRAFRRFGPPAAEAPALAMGKRQLAGNAAALVERAKRWHLLGPPYAALVAARLAVTLGIREAEPAAREAAIARVLAARGIEPDYAARAQALRRGRHPAELLRAAGALWTIERTLAP
jgi:hypothetical protein